jgi:hypothetical protein
MVTWESTAGRTLASLLQLSKRLVADCLLEPRSQLGERKVFREGRKVRSTLAEIAHESATRAAARFESSTGEPASPDS